MQALARDLRHALRLLARNPGFTFTVVLILALGIGANAAVFSLVDALLLRPLPYPQPERLALVGTAAGGRLAGFNQDGRTWELVRDHVPTARAAAFSNWSTGVNLVVGGPRGQAVRVAQQRIGHGFFAVLGVEPLLGRELTAEEDRAGGPAAVVLSHGLWQRLFGGDPAVLGRTVTLRGEPATVVGVMPRGFETAVPADLWTALRPSTTGEGQGTNYQIAARLRPGASWAAARAQAASLSAEAFRGWPAEPGAPLRLTLAPLQEALTADARQPVLLLSAAVGVVLLIVCTNVAALLLAGASRRGREIATRMAVGGSRAAVVRQLLVESGVLAALGALAGLAVGYLSLEGLTRLGSEIFGAASGARIDLRVIAATALVAAATALLFGLAPALHAAQSGERTLAHGMRGSDSAGGLAGRRPRRLLVVGEVALGVMLLVAAGLLIRTVAYLHGLPPGFDPGGVLTASVSLDDARYEERERAVRLFDETLRRLSAQPGVAVATVALTLPYERPLNIGCQFPGARAGEPAQGNTDLNYVTAGYFAALRVPLLAGRAFSARDGAGAEPVAIVSREFARRYFPAGRPADALGREVVAGLGPRLRIVGLAGDVQVAPAWGDYGPRAATPMVYLPAAQMPGDLMKLAHGYFSPHWIVRTAGPVAGPIAGAAAGIEKAIEGVDPRLPIAGFRAMPEVEAEAISTYRSRRVLATLFAAMALALAALGIYGLIARSVAERTRELGIRMALGSTLSQAMRTVAFEGIALALVGVVLGSLLARQAAQLLRSFLWGVAPGDAATFATVVSTMLVVAAFASLLPAQRVLRLDPTEALRHD